MIEYGHAVGEGSGAAGSAGGGASVDVGTDILNAASDAVDRVAALPPEGLLVVAAVILAGLLILKRAF